MSGPARPTRAYAMAQRRAPASRLCGVSKTLQPKLDVTPAGDRYEAEADRVAAQVMGTSTAPAMPQISSLIGSPGGQRAGKEGTAVNAKKTEDLKEKESSGKTAQSKMKAPVKDEKPKSVQKKTKERADDEKKPRAAQKKTKAPVKDEKPKSVQKKTKERADDDKTSKAAQKKTKAPVMDEKPEKKAQRDASGHGFSAPAATEGAIDSMQRSGGAPLEASTRSFMEGRIGRDFSGVQIHDTPAAHRAADDLGAHAFTVGQDVFFARGAYRPDTGEGRRLIAHELTHTVQQAGGSAQAKRAQRAGSAPSSTKVWAKPNTTDQIIDVPKKELTVPTIKLPKVNGKWKGGPIVGHTKGVVDDKRTSNITGTGPFVLYRPTTRKGGQRELWLEGAKTNLSSGLQDKIKKVERPPANDYTPVTTDGTPSGDEVFAFRKKKGKASSAGDVIVGTATELSETPSLIIPTWNREGTTRVGSSGYQVDHVHELQLGGKHDYSNLWLLHASANQKSGGIIKAGVEEPIKQIAKDARSAGFWADDKGGTEPSLKTFKKDWQIKFMTYAEVPLGASAVQSESYTKEDIKGGDQLKGLKMMGNKERSDAGLLVDPTNKAQPTEFSIYPYPTGGIRFIIKKKGAKWKLHNRTMKAFLGGFSDIAFNYTYDAAKGDGEELGSIVGTPKPTKSGVKYNSTTLRLLKKKNLGYGVYLDPQDLKSFPRNSSFIGLSPIEFDDFGVAEDGLFRGHGWISATPYLLAGTQVPFEIHGDEITLDFLIPTDNLNLGPISIEQASIELGYNAQGIFLGGTADISVNQLGSGHLEAKAGKSGPRIEGDFNFDFNFLDNPSAKFLYDMGEDTLELMLEAGVQKGKIPGIQSGNITATFSKEEIDVTGTLQPIGFLSAAAITVSYTREQGLKMEATDVPLPLGNLPAVKDAKVTVGIRRSPEGDWTLFGGGSASFALPAVTGGITLLVNDDILTFTGTGNVAKGPASGTLNFTASNQAIDEQGQPLSGPSLDSFRTWGKGSVTVSFGKIITGTAEIELTETNEIIVVGGIALPPTFEVFPIRKYEKQLLHVEPPEFPIWGVSVAGVGIGVFAFVDAKLNFDAFVGPGQLKDTELEFSYNFMKPEEASVEGNANFDVPAGAGFMLDIGGGLRARLTTAQVSGRIGLDGRLGIEANAGADVRVEWNPADGLELNSRAYAEASPKFEIGANASVTASVDLFLAEPSYTWGPWRKQLGTFGPAMAVGIEFPMSWSEKNGLDLSLDNIKVTKPDIDPKALMKDAFLELV